MVHSLEHILMVLVLVLVALVCATDPVAGEVSVESVVTESFFDGIKSQSSSSGCEGTSFYTRGAFLNAVQMYYPGFAQDGSEDDGKRVLAAFFAHVTHESGSMCYINEVNPSMNFCDTTKPQWPCAPGQRYYGRGPLQLSWNYNYGAAGKDLGFDGLGNPDTLAKDPVVSFEAALWYWKNNMLQRFMSQGFGGSIRAINSQECNGGPHTDKMEDRVRLYKQYCQQFGVDSGTSLTC